MGTHRVREDAWPLESPLENPRPSPPVPMSFLRTLCLRGWERCRDVWPMGNRTVLWVAGWASISPDRCLGTLCKWSDPSRVGHVTRGRLLVRSLSAHARPGPNLTPASRGSEKSHLLGASPCSPKRKRGPVYAWKNRGIFAVVGTGRRGLRVCLHVRQVLTQGAQVFEPRGGRGLLIAGCKCPAGSRKGMGTPGRHRAPGLIEFPGKSPAQAPVPKSVFRTLSVSGW